MTTLERKYVILAALQFDETGTIAMEEAVRIARRDPAAELHVLHVAAPSLARDRDGESTAIEAQLERAPGKLREYVERASEGTSLHVVGHIRSGTPVQVILQTAADLDADMIVLGTHTHRGAIDRLVLGSVSGRVLHQAHCPVLVAVPKAYGALAETQAIEPPCPECVEQQRATGDRHVYCERHSRTRLRPHVYVPSDRPRASVAGV
jgi:nucleotide-binding universal stress UspA family protein